MAIYAGNTLPPFTSLLFLPECLLQTIKQVIDEPLVLGLYCELYKV